MADFRKKGLRGLVFIVVMVLCAVTFAYADPVTINKTRNLRVNASVNTAGFLVGDTLRFGANEILPSGLSTTVTATQGGVTIDVPFTGGSLGIDDEVFPNQYRAWIAYDPVLTGQWKLTATNGTDSTSKKTDAIGSVAIMPFATDVKISETGANSIISWNIPPNAASANRARIYIFDDEAPAVPRKTLIYRSAPIPLTETSFAVPADADLKPGHRYALRIEIDQTDDSTLSGNTLNKSEVYFTMVPLTTSAPPNVFLPMGDGTFFGFDFSVTPGETYYIDPLVAIGYQYAIGLGDPNIASVLLPNIGDGLFAIYGLDGTTFLGNATAGTPFNFVLARLSGFGGYANRKPL